MFGIDYLGGATYGDVILNNHPKGWGAGFFLKNAIVYLLGIKSRNGCGENSSQPSDQLS